MAALASSGCTFYDKTLKNGYVNFVNEHFTEERYEVSYRYEMLGAKIRKEEAKTRCCSKNISKFLAQAFHLGRIAMILQ